VSQELNLEQRERPRSGGMPKWKKLLLLLAVVLTLAGLALRGYAHLRPGEPTAQQADGAPALAPVGQANGAGQARSFLPGAPTAEPAGAGQAPAAGGAEPGPVPAAAPLEVWSPVMVRLGFGFIAGFCIAYLLRAFVRVAALALGLAVLLVLGLQYAGLVQVDWAAIDGHYQASAQWLTGQFAGFRQFVTGQLPSAATGAAGLAIGLKRN
jgi:uncharacterized membrane protein (Fun14 family)